MTTERFPRGIPEAVASARVRIRAGAAIRLIRQVRGLEQKDLAKFAELDPSYINLIEAGKRQPSLAALARICGVLAVAPSELLALAEDREGALDRLLGRRP